jgi:hypothetical protein
VIYSKQSLLAYEGVSKTFRTGRLERELQMLQLCATRCSCIAIFLGGGVSLVSFAAITLCVTCQRMFIVVVYFVIVSVRKVLDKPSYEQTNRFIEVFIFCTRRPSGHSKELFWNSPGGFGKTTNGRWPNRVISECEARWNLVPWKI